MSTRRKAMLEVCKMTMTPSLSAEHQRKWDESRWECKLDDPERNYDHSRAHLNFEIRKGGKIASIDQTVCIKEKVLPRQVQNQRFVVHSTNQFALSWVAIVNG